jgi:hypothetical protein
MFGSPKRNVFKPTAYGNTRRARRIPRWLVLMLTGIVLGAGGLLFLQKSYGPTRLTVEQSEQLHYDLNSINLDKQRLQSQLNQQTHDLGEAKSSLGSQASQLQQSQAQLAKLQKDLQLFIAAMPPDPRGTSPGIRAADFKNNGGKLDYQILVMQDENKAANFQGDMELLVEGRYANGKRNTIPLPGVSIELQRYTHVQGEADLPPGFTPYQATIRILNHNTKKLSATRVIRVAR